MIEKMEFISITGPKADIDRIVDQYLSKYEIHLENALAELKTVQHLTPYLQINPYKSLLSRAAELEKLLDEPESSGYRELSLESAVSLVEDLDRKLTRLNQERKDLEDRKKHIQELLTTLKPFEHLEYDISRLLHFQFVSCQFGKIPKEYYSKFETYIYENMETLFYRCYADDHYIWGMYFCPRAEADRVDAVYASMHFEQLDVPEELQGIPQEVSRNLSIQLSDIRQSLISVEGQIRQMIHQQGGSLRAACRKLEAQSRNFDIRKLAACTREKNREVFYILCGWMTQKDALAFQQEISQDGNLYCFVENDSSNGHREPPTKLKNPGIFKPFEMFVRMYGLPSYTEIDPTVFLALTYILIFGAMFGDAGQGLCLSLIGFLLYRFKKLELGAIIGAAGICSAIFGLLFGSIFGFEDVLPALWLKPVTAMADVPFLGKLNTVFVVSIGFGMFLILLTMIFHIINGIHSKDPENIWFDQNAVAGLVFYGSLTAVILLFTTGHRVPGAIVLILMFGIPLLIIMLKEPLSRLVTRQSPLIREGKAMFFVQSFFELFEVMLSYLSNTLSFIRIGAFAVSHASMMEVVLMLAGAESGSPNWVIVILGNLFVMGMEGLIVGIQVLRLEYYELFSRYYKGSGKPFRPFLNKNQHETMN